jgi:hypothetical protein
MLSIKLTLIPIVGNMIANQIFAQRKESNSHTKILYEEHVKNSCYLKLNFKNE